MIFEDGKITEILCPFLSVLFYRFKGLVICLSIFFCFLFQHEMLLFPVELRQNLLFLRKNFAILCEQLSKLITDILGLYELGS